MMYYIILISFIIVLLVSTKLFKKRYRYAQLRELEAHKAEMAKIHEWHKSLEAKQRSEKIDIILEALERHEYRSDKQ
ncbi:hypothetical protein [Staphylococcus aureus]|uniref:hypothetical protein n=1 Tax=Staphylococcus aureus TaxID=1280 RepID=UPI003B9F0CF3